jgi:hypothetical protein
MKKVLLALALVAFMASSAFAVTVNLETVGLLNGSTIAGDGETTSDPLMATAVSFGVTPDISLAIGAASIAVDPQDGAGTKSNTLALYVNGFYKLLQTGAISQNIGLEVALVTESEGETANTRIDLVYRAAAQVLGEVSLLFDVELIALDSGTTNAGDANGATTTILNAAKVGFSVPLM